MDTQESLALAPLITIHSPPTLLSF